MICSPNAILHINDIRWIRANHIYMYELQQIMKGKRQTKALPGCIIYVGLCLWNQESGYWWDEDQWLGISEKFLFNIYLFIWKKGRERSHPSTGSLPIRWPQWPGLVKVSSQLLPLGHPSGCQGLKHFGSSSVVLSRSSAQSSIGSGAARTHWTLGEMLTFEAAV